MGGVGEEGLRERVGEVRERVGTLLIVQARGEDEHVQPGRGAGYGGAVGDCA